MVTTKGLGDDAEDRALEHLLANGLKLVERNYRIARGPSQRGGEIDLILRERDSTLVFVEVRKRSRHDFGGAAASITASKQAKLLTTARQYLAQLGREVPCRFDAVLIDGAGHIEWLRNAFGE